MGRYRMTCADFASYIKAQKKPPPSTKTKSLVRSAILNSAASGKFSTDRTMQDYKTDIWESLR